jgi:hypothetical protein
VSCGLGSISVTIAGIPPSLPSADLPHLPTKPAFPSVGIDLGLGSLDVSLAGIPPSPSERGLPERLDLAVDRHGISDLDRST